MKRVIRFSRGYLPAAIFSSVMVVACLVGYFAFGFNLGVDFQAGMSQTVQFAYPALTVTYEGKGTATLSATATGLTAVFSGAEVENKTVVLSFAQYASLGAIAEALNALPDIKTELKSDEALSSKSILPTSQSDTRLGAEPLYLQRPSASKEDGFAPIEDVRKIVEKIGVASIQVVGNPVEQVYAIRVSDPGTDKEFSRTITARMQAALEEAFGKEKVVVIKTDFVGARFSKTLTRSVIWLTLGTIVLILIYASLRFHPQYAIGAVLAIIHDALAMVGFIAWTRLEFNTSTIAAILTILGYSINDTIVIFDRVREDRRMNPNANFVDLVDNALTETLGRTIITAIATFLCVLSLYFFTTGSMKDFSLALIVGMISGTYSTVFIATAFVVFWQRVVDKKAKDQLVAAHEAKVAGRVSAPSSKANKEKRAKKAAEKNNIVKEKKPADGTQEGKK